MGKKAVQLGAGEILLTSMDGDGTKNGYDIPLTKAISEAVSVPVIASGGCGNAAHMVEVLKKQTQPPHSPQVFFTTAN